MKRQYLSPFIFLLGLLALALPLFAANPLQVSSNGVAQCPIYYKQTTEDGKAAAEKLKLWLDQMTGADFTVSAWDGTGTPRAIIVASADEFSAKADTHDLELLGPEGFAAWNESGAGWEQTWILGNNDSALQSGIRNGVYRLLDSLGCRWYFPEYSGVWNVIPDTPNLSLNPNIREEPDFGYRNVWYGDVVWTLPGTGGLSGYNTWWDWQERNTAPGAKYIYAGHSYEWRVPSATYFSSHPEYYGYWEGARQPWQLCVTNTDMQAIFMQSITDDFTNDPTLDYASVEANDGPGMCNCANCLNVGDGSDSDVTFYLANLAADYVATNHPGKSVALYAYGTHADPPSFNLRDNMYVQFTTGFRFHGDYGEEPAYTTLEEAVESFRDKGIEGAGVYSYFAGWLADHDLPTTYGAEIFTVASTIKDWETTMGFSTMELEASDNWGSHGLGYYISTKLGWDADQDVNEIIDDFATNCFGDVAPQMKRFYVRMGSWPYGPGEIKMALQDIEEALRLNTDSAIEERIKRVAMFAHYMKLADELYVAQQTGASLAARQAIEHQLGVWVGRLSITELLHTGAFNHSASDFWFNYDLTSQQVTADIYTGEYLGLPSDYEVAYNLYADMVYYSGAEGCDVDIKTYSTDLRSIDAVRESRVTDWGNVTPSHIYFQDGTIYFIGAASTEYTVSYEEWPDMPVSGEWTLTRVSDGSVISSGNTDDEIQFTTTSAGVYAFDPGLVYSESAVITFSPAVPFSFYIDKGPTELFQVWYIDPPNDYMYVYVPKGTSGFAIDVVSTVSNPDISVSTADGTIVYGPTTLTTWPQMFFVEVPEGKDGQIYRIKVGGGAMDIRMGVFGIPPYIARCPEELITPAECIQVEANDQAVSTNESTTYNGTLTSSQIDDDPVTYSLVSNGAHGTATITNSSTGAFNYVPTSGFWGADTFTFKVNDGTYDSNTATVSVTINSVGGGNAPTGTADSYGTQGHGALNIVAPGVLKNDTDSEGDALTAVLVSGPSSGNVKLRADGSFTYIHNGTTGGNDSFVYKAYDGNSYSGNVTVSVTTSAMISTTNLKAWFRPDAGITKDGSNYVGTWQEQSTSARSFNQATQANKPLYVADGINHQPMVYFDGSDDRLISSTTANLFGSTAGFTLVGVFQPDATQTDYAAIFAQVGPSGKSLVLNRYYDGDPWFVWWYTGTAYQNLDNTRGAQMTPNVPNLFMANKNTSTNIKTYLNDALVDNFTVSASALGQETGSTLCLGAYDATYYPYKGNISEFLVYNRSLSTAEQTTMSNYLRTKYGLGVAPSNPTNDGTYNATEETVLNVSAGSGLLANDAADPEGRALTAKLATSPGHGVAVVNADGSFMYMPAKDFYGTDTFTYKTNNGQVDSASAATVTISVANVNDAPTAVMTSPLFGSTIYAPSPILVSATATDADGNAIAKVEFYKDDTLIATDTVTPYEVIDANVTATTPYTYYAKVYESGTGLNTQSPSVTTYYFPVVNPAEGGNGYSPAGLEAWYKADAGVTKDGSNNVTAWADQSGNGHTATVPQYAYSPKWVSSGIAGQNALQWVNGAWSGLATSFDPGSWGLTFFFVTKTGTTAIGYNTVLGSSTTTGMDWHLGTWSAANYGTGQGGTDAAPIGLGAAASSTNRLYQNSYRMDNYAHLWRVNQNGINKANMLADSTWPTSNYMLKIGADSFASGGPTGPIVGYIGEILVYKAVLTDDEMQGVEAYLRSRYNTNPTATNKSFTIAHNGTYNGTLTGGDADNADTKRFYITQQGTLGTAEITGLTSGGIRYYAGPNTGTDILKFKVTDGYGHSSEATITVTVN